MFFQKIRFQDFFLIWSFFCFFLSKIRFILYLILNKINLVCFRFWKSYWKISLIMNDHLSITIIVLFQSSKIIIEYYLFLFILKINSVNFVLFIWYINAYKLAWSFLIRILKNYKKFICVLIIRFQILIFIADFKVELLNFQTLLSSKGILKNEKVKVFYLFLNVNCSLKVILCDPSFWSTSNWIMMLNWSQIFHY